MKKAEMIAAGYAFKSETLSCYTYQTFESPYNFDELDSQE